MAGRVHQLVYLSVHPLKVSYRALSSIIQWRYEIASRFSTQADDRSVATSSSRHLDARVHTVILPAVQNSQGMCVRAASHSMCGGDKVERVKCVALRVVHSF